MCRWLSDGVTKQADVGVCLTLAGLACRPILIRNDPPGATRRSGRRRGAAISASARERSRPDLSVSSRPTARLRLHQRGVHRDHRTPARRVLRGSGTRPDVRPSGRSPHHRAGVSGRSGQTAARDPDPLGASGRTDRLRRTPPGARARSSWAHRRHRRGRTRHHRESRDRNPVARIGASAEASRRQHAISPRRRAGTPLAGAARRARTDPDHPEHGPDPDRPRSDSPRAAAEPGGPHAVDGRQHRSRDRDGAPAGVNASAAGARSSRSRRGD